jgi:uncharacterized protein (DUF342 family)
MDDDKFFKTMKEELLFIKTLKRIGMIWEANQHISTSLRMLEKEIEREKKRLRYLKLLYARFKREKMEADGKWAIVRR